MYRNGSGCVGWHHYFTLHNVKGKDDLKVIFQRLCRYRESNGHHHALDAARVSDTVLCYGSHCSVLPEALAGEWGYLGKATEVSGPGSHRT